MYETIVITATALSLFVTLALELSDSRFDRRRFAQLRAAKAAQPALATEPVAERCQFIPLDQAA